MTLANLLIFGLVLFLLYVVIQRFLPEPMKVWAYGVVGVAAILYLIARLWPGLLNLRISA